MPTVLTPEQTAHLQALLAAENAAAEAANEATSKADAARNARVKAQQDAGQPLQAKIQALQNEAAALVNSTMQDEAVATQASQAATDAYGSARAARESYETELQQTPVVESPGRGGKVGKF